MLTASSLAPEILTRDNILVRYISGLPLFIFSAVVFFCLSLSCIACFALRKTYGVEFVFLIPLFIFLFYCSLIFFYRLWIYFFPITEGNVEVGSRNELNFMVTILFWLLFFNPIVIPCWVPLPLTRIMYILFGAKMGPRTYSGGVIYDPQFVEIGSRTLLGAKSMLVPHFSQGHRLEHHRIKIGNDVTVGAMSIVLAGCELADGSILGALSLLPKNSKVGPNEVWAGQPAKFLRMRSPEDLFGDHKPHPGHSLTCRR